MCSTQAQHLPEPRRQPVLPRGAASPAVGTRMGLRMMLGDVIRMSTATRGASGRLLMPAAERASAVRQTRGPR